VKPNDVNQLLNAICELAGAPATVDSPPVSLQPSTMWSAICEWRRGSLPSTAIPGRSGGKSSSGRGHEFDSFDQKLMDTWGKYCAHIATGRIELLGAMRAQNGLLIVAPPLPDEYCETCGIVVDDGRKECAKCRTHRSRHGMPWPRTA
jgi:hypothetical protein